MDLGIEDVGVNFSQHLALVHLVAFIHHQPGQAPAHLGCYRHLADLNKARSGDAGLFSLGRRQFQFDQHSFPGSQH
jgi:hypothetical protein